MTMGRIKPESKMTDGNNDAFLALVQSIWKDYANPTTNTIRQKSLKQILQRLNFSISTSNMAKKRRFKQALKEMSIEDPSCQLTQVQTALFLHTLKRFMNQDGPVESLWKKCFAKGRFVPEEVSAEEFLFKFLVAVQGETASLALLKKVEERFAQWTEGQDWKIHEKGKSCRLHGQDLASKQQYLHREQFESYLCASHNDVYDPKRQQLRPQDMTKPLSHYWINSSHNTYLSGDQLTSRGSVDMYTEALRRGCRCVEIDVWDKEHNKDKAKDRAAYAQRSNSSFSSSCSSLSSCGNGSTTRRYIPKVKHGHTMTTKIDFQDVIVAIQQFLLDHPLSYPIIISLENHCSLPYQEGMAQVLHEVLGDMLFVPTKKDFEGGHLPSPERLRGKVVLKGRRPLDVPKDAGGSRRDDSVEFLWNKEVEEQMNQTVEEHIHSSHVGDEEEHESYSTRSSTSTTSTSTSTSTTSSTHNISPQLAQCTLLHGTHFSSFHQSTNLNPTHFMHTFRESQLRLLHWKNKHQPFIEYNRTHLSRTYPSRGRVESSNACPLRAWSMGCHMVAMNVQTSGQRSVSLRMNDGLFRLNGGCGYVLKPKELMMDHDPTATSIPKGTPVKTFCGKEVMTPMMRLKIKILCANLLPKPKGQTKGECIDPYIRIDLYDIHKQKQQRVSNTKFRTKLVHDNGFCPIWNESTAFMVQSRELALVMFTVWDWDAPGRKGNDFIASAAIPVSALRRGVRCVRLWDEHNSRRGVFEYMSLLVQVEKEEVEGD